MMRFSTICISTALAVASIGIAQANLVVNGDFSQTTLSNEVPTQFGTRSNNGYTATQFITGWTGNNGYEIWYPDAKAAYTDNAFSEWGQGSTANTGNEKLYPSISAPPNTTAFVGLDGEQTDGIQSSISQQLNGLIAGATYNVSFDWGAAQLQSRTGDTTEFLRVSLGTETQDTDLLNNPSEGFTGWFSKTFQFVADSADPILTFLSVGTPTGLPPIAVLTNVSVTQAVPEPSTLALFGSGLLGLGLIARRRTQRRRRERRDSDMD